jgi:hypothetical protein
MLRLNTVVLEIKFLDASMTISKIKPHPSRLETNRSCFEVQHQAVKLSSMFTRTSGSKRPALAYSTVIFKRRLPTTYKLPSPDGGLAQYDDD